MAKDELAGLGLDDDEIELIKSRRKQRKEEADTEIWVKDGDREARLPLGQGRNWLKRHGFLLDDDAEPEPEEEEEPEEEPKDKPVRFAGRRVS